MMKPMTPQTAMSKGGGGMGTINFFDKKKADELAELGFKYVEHKINAEQVIYSFVDTPKLREKLSGNYAKTEYYFSKYHYM